MSTVTRQRILVVDDEPLVCESVRMLLTYEGHHVQTASCGEDALLKHSQAEFDIVITDFAMPGMKGDELSQNLKQRAPSKPVILLTAFPPSRQPETVDLILTKPFYLDTLRQGIAKVLSGS